MCNLQIANKCSNSYHLFFTELPFISTKFDDQRRGKFQSSAIEKVNIANDTDRICLVYKKSANNLRYIAINDAKDF